MTPYTGKVHFAIMNKEGKFKTMGYTDRKNLSNHVLEFELHNTCNYYISSNTVNGGSMKKSQLRTINNIVIDIDCHACDVKGKNNVEPYELSEILDDLIYYAKKDICNKIPEWNIEHRTGRGIQLWWCLEQNNHIYAEMWNRVVTAYIKLFQELIDEYSCLSKLSVDVGASKKIVGYFRLFNTYNTKSDTNTVAIINNNQKYSLQELKKNLPVEELPIQEKKIVKARNNEGSKISINALYHRLKLIEGLIGNRDMPQGMETRNNYILIYYNTCVQIYSAELAKRKTQELNTMFKQPLGDLDYIFSYIDNKGFLRYRNKTIIDFLNISEIEQELYQFFVNTQMMSLSKFKQNATRDNERSVRKEERNHKVVELYQQGIKKTEIAEIVNVSRPTIDKILKECI